MSRNTWNRDLWWCVLTTVIVYGGCVLFTSPCSVSNRASRFSSCPPGTCCCKDPFMPNAPYCKPIGTQGSNCNAKEPNTLASCGCVAGLVCKPNVVAATYVSKYGTCQNTTK